MMSELIERFRYRLQLWHRDRREDLFGMPRSDPRSLREYTDEHSPDKANDPGYRAVIVESMPRFVIRGVGVYFGVVIILAQLCRVALAYFPSARFAVSIVFLVLVAFWTFGMVLGTIDFCRRRKAYWEEVTKSSNKSLEPTAGRRDAHV
jgi:hypothetical protein